MAWPRAAVLLLSIATTGCGLIPEEAVGLECQEPPSAEEVLRVPAPPQAIGVDPEEAAFRIEELDIIPSWRYSYFTEPPGRTAMYTECWCVVPPDGTVSQVSAEPGEQLIVFVQRAEPIPGGRPQPTRGWGCEEG